MKTLLYISINSKPENLSSSKTVARKFINAFLEKHKEFVLEELDLYKTHIPRLKYEYFENRNSILKKEDFNKLTEREKDEVHKIVELVDQFKNADLYVFAAPMWNLSFPAPLKEYIDCVVMDGKTVSINDDKIEGLLNDRYRAALYIQSSGASIPWLLKIVMNKGLNYVEDIMKFMGIKKFEELLVDGTGSTEKEKEKAIASAEDKINEIVDDIWRK
ncbi:FMN-dependent NADH-azoreductase [Clostridium oryzae]|uniref:FMN dependent NADH:quinone oxidoreductase n=1 Tax=Clostridium oryzae TaxID=1450648 RepID=A0A1V4IPT3_9CLOT|nr:NAD(P)H-dependent oxidoreductase [Clostridium oryzae]OPJ61899.1 FMN-dependent NADH-azoreductase 2 [Clostridium oryzae]